jgi:hypothetical protein
MYKFQTESELDVKTISDNLEEAISDTSIADRFFDWRKSNFGFRKADGYCIIKKGLVFSNLPKNKAFIEFEPDNGKTIIKASVSIPIINSLFAIIISIPLLFEAINLIIRNVFAGAVFYFSISLIFIGISYYQFTSRKQKAKEYFDSIIISINGKET